MPSTIKYCLETIERHCPDFELLTPESWPLDCCEYLKPHQRANLVRLEYLYEHGGTWVDADTIMLRTPNMYEKIDKWDIEAVSVHGHEHRLFPISFFAAKPQSKLVQMALNRVRCSPDRRVQQIFKALIKEEKFEVLSLPSWLMHGAPPANAGGRGSVFMHRASDPAHEESEFYYDAAYGYHLQNMVIHSLAGLDFNKSTTFGAFLYRKAMEESNNGV
jgi:hypothetical protein